MLRDILYALRALRRNPGFTAAAVLSIALGIGANATVFSVVNGLLLGTLPVERPDRLAAFAGGRSDFSYPDYLDYRDQTRDVFQGLTAHCPLAPASFAGGGEPERIWGQLVSGNWFAVMGVRPALGRGIAPHEDSVPGRDAVVVLSHALWRRRFASDPAVLGRAVLLNGQPYTVIGVAPAGFVGADRGILPEFWAPLAMLGQILPDLGRDNATARRGSSWLVVHGRLKDGVDRARAQAAVAVVKQRIDDAYFRGNERRRRRVVTLDKPGALIDGGASQVGGLMAVLMAVVGLVLLIACANVANLLLARGAARRKEMAVRMAVGAGRCRIVRQLLAESLVLAAAGAAAGFALAYWAATALTRFEPPVQFPIGFDFVPDARVLAFTALLSALTGVLFGLAPALRSTRPGLVEALKSGAGSAGAGRGAGLRGALVVAQVALSLVLLAATGLFLRSLHNASRIDTGLRPGNVLLMAVDPKQHSYPAEKTARLLAHLRAHVAALPDVRAVTFVDTLPLSVTGSSSDFQTTGAAGEKAANADVYNVGSGYFATMGVPIVRGRDFHLGNDGDGVAIINATLAGRLFGGADPLGQQVTSRKDRYTVIGVAADSKSRTLGEPPAACAYLFLEARPGEVMSYFGISLAVKTGGDPRLMERAVRRQIASFDPALAVFNTGTMREHMERVLLLPRLSAALMGVFGAIGLVLASIGLYGVISYGVERRTREFGIRMALGAPRAGVLRMVLRQGLAMAGLGMAIGLAMALALGRFAAGLLYGVDAADAVTFTVVPAVLLAVALAAILTPALRASRVTPMSALREE